VIRFHVGIEVPLCSDGHCHCCRICRAVGDDPRSSRRAPGAAPPQLISVHRRRRRADRSIVRPRTPELQRSPRTAIAKKKRRRRSAAAARPRRLEQVGLLSGSVFGIARKKQNTLPDVQRLDLAYVSCAAGPARPDGKLRRNKTLPNVQRLDLAYVSSAAGPAKPDGKLKRIADVDLTPRAHARDRNESG
jgi:hypothetical protein